MILPRFTVKRLFAITAVAALFFAIASAGFRGMQAETSEDMNARAGNPAFAAAAVAVAVGALAAGGLVFAGLFAAAWLAAEMTNWVRPKRGPSSPFAVHTPAPQLLPPEEPT